MTKVTATIEFEVFVPPGWTYEMVLDYVKSGSAIVDLPKLEDTGPLITIAPIVHHDAVILLRNVVVEVPLEGIQPG